MKKRVLLVDDAAAIRTALSLAIAQDQDLEVVGTAANGRVALEIFPALKPDIVLLDFEMPQMDGLATVREIRKKDACVPIIMFSNLTERGAAVTLEALSSGVTDYVTKPSNVDMTATLEAISRELIPKIRALCHLPELPNRLAPPERQSPPVPISLSPRLPSPVQIVAIGVSTGGPDALARVLSSLPANFPVPVVIAQHMPSSFTSLLASRLSAKSALPVRECVSGEPLRSGRVVIAPGDFHMVLSQDDGRLLLKTHQGPKENFCRPSVDVLFHSIARVFGARALAVVLTGMGQDGLKGCETLHGLGAQIYVQDEASSVVWGMPGLVARSGLADKILPLNRIGAEIVRATALRIAARSPG
ncbi:MAG: protein-glutamate methylesterase/protein-glutamine glutaminase [Candidatus Sulfotelmatobacter sp.]